MTRRGFLLAVTALLGITVAAALTWSVSRLSGQRIGLWSEPPSVIQGLAPPHAPPADRARTAVPSQRAIGRPRTSSSPPRPTPPVSLPTTPSPVAPTPATAAPVAPRSNASDHHDDSGGSSGGASGAARAGRDD